MFQDAPELGEDATVTSYVWIVDPAYVAPAKQVRINEILAANTKTLTNGLNTPDLVELRNDGTAPLDLTNLGLSDDPALPYKYRFPSGLPALPPGGHLVVYADSASGTPGIHLGFALSAQGDSLLLTDAASGGSPGSVLDQITFGLQIADLSLGRAEDGTWVLCEPTFGALNHAMSLGPVENLLVNEWLSDELFMATSDFVEIFNPSPLPVNFGGCYLTDSEGSPTLSRVPDYSYLAPNSHTAFIADGEPSKGADHLNFTLRADTGIVGLFDRNQQPIDVITYGPQMLDISEGRSPSGSEFIGSFQQPTPGAPNPGPRGGVTITTNITARLVPLISITNTWSYDNSGIELDGSWRSLAFPDASWPTAALFGSNPASQYPSHSSHLFRRPHNRAGI
jgi:hypothetical protein